MSAPTRSAPPVALVGGGPGDAGLLTLRAEALLAVARTVVADRSLRALAGAWAVTARVVVVEDGAAAAAELLAAARGGAAPVVRLYRGDPWLHRAHGAEARALAWAGVATEVVPGVATELAVAGLAGVPLHVRQLAVAATLAPTAEEAPAPVDPSHTVVATSTDLRRDAAALAARGDRRLPAVAIPDRPGPGAAGEPPPWAPLRELAAVAPAGAGLVVCGAVCRAVDRPGRPAAGERTP